LSAILFQNELFRTCLLEGALIRVFKKPQKNSEYLKYGIDIDPRVNQLNLEKIKNICPRKVFEINKNETPKI